MHNTFEIVSAVWCQYLFNFNTTLCDRIRVKCRHNKQVQSCFNGWIQDKQQLFSVDPNPKTFSTHTTKYIIWSQFQFMESIKWIDIESISCNHELCSNAIDIFCCCFLLKIYFGWSDGQADGWTVGLTPVRLISITVLQSYVWKSMKNFKMHLFFRRSSQNPICFDEPFEPMKVHYSKFQTFNFNPIHANKKMILKKRINSKSTANNFHETISNQYIQLSIS